MSFPKLASLYAICTVVFFAMGLVWGTTVTSIVAVAGYYAGRWLGIG